jgi:hypothetical protein
MPRKSKIVKMENLNDFDISHIDQYLPDDLIDRISFNEGGFQFEKQNVSEDVKKFLNAEFGCQQVAIDDIRDNKGKQRVSIGKYKKYQNGLVKLCFERYEYVFRLQYEDEDGP